MSQTFKGAVCDARSERFNVKDAKRIWMRFLVLVPLAVVLVVASRAYVHQVGGTYSMNLESVGYAGLVSADDVVFLPEGVVAVESVEPAGNGEGCILTIRAVRDGEAVAELGAQSFGVLVRVENGVIIEGGVNFSGWESVLVSIIVFLAVAIALLISALRWLHKRTWFGYEMVFCCGALVFSTVQLVLFSAQWISGQADSFESLVVSIVGATDRFLFLTFIPVAIGAVAVVVSNISLIRHEGLRPVNVLGIVVCAFCLMVNVWWLFFGDSLYSALRDIVAIMVVDSAVAVAIAYGECLLLAIIVCAWQAARRAPRREADYVIVLGCGLLADGTPTPILRGRIERALAFDAQQVQKGAGPTTFVASGGQGPDEVMSEAESMQRYLQDRGISDDRILLEDHSMRTIDNMMFSREAIENATRSDIAHSRVAFSTTNYHVFRSYVCAHKAGIDAEGMASPTRAYFWPNAFVREIIGLIVDRWYAVLITYALIAAANGLLQYALLLA